MVQALKADSNGERTDTFRLILKIMFCLLLFIVLLKSVLYHGWTRWTGGQKIYYIDKNVLQIIVTSLFALLSIAEFSVSPLRSLLGIGLSVAYWFTGEMYGIPRLLEGIILALLCNLSTQKWNCITWLSVRIIYIPILILLSEAGLVYSIYSSPDKLFFVQHMGSSYGMGHPNTVAIFLMTLLLMIWYLVHPKKKWITFLMFYICAIIIMYLTMSRTVFIQMATFPILWIVVQNFAKKNSKWKICLIGALPWILLILCILLSLYASYRKEGMLESAFWMRFTDFRIFVSNPVYLFGETSTAGFRDIMLDNVYYWLTANCGIIPAVLAIAGYSYMNVKLLKEGKKELLAISLLFLLYGIMENGAVYPILFFVPILCFSEKSHKKMENMPSTTGLS